MKTLMLRVCYLGVAVTTILASPGTEEPASPDAIDPVADVLAPLQIADADALAEADLPAPLLAVGDTNAPSVPPIPMQEPTPPPNVKLSPALAEVVKLIQAGVSPDVLMAYVTNSTAVFNVNSDTIVYLNDLGVTNTVITALIQHDALPETAARRASTIAAQALPPGVAATAPVTDVYPPAARTTFPAAGQTTYPGDFTGVDTNAEPSDLQPAVVTAPLAPANDNVTVNHFYSSLAPYGSWVDVDGYGLCWRPTVAVHDPYWRPYGDRGRWLLSDAGWYWYSDYSWGWAPFHYGRWCSYPRLGWIWVPGTVWAPSWVTWRYTDSYCGWAPLPPGCGYRSGIGLTWYGRGVSIGFDFGLSSHCWSYVPTSRFCDWNVRRHCLPDNRLHVVHRTAIHANRISVRNKSIVNDGIEPNTIARASRTKIPTMKIKDGVLPANNSLKPERLENRGNELAVVRPKLPKAAPATVAPVASRGSATRGKPVTIGNSGQAVAKPADRAVAPNTIAPREVARNNAPATGIVRDQGNAKRHEGVTIRPQNRPAPEPKASTPNLQRQTPAPAQQRSAPVQAPRNNVAANPAPAPVTRNPSPVARNFAPAQNQPAARPAPQAAPAQRSVSPMIRSYAQPQQRSTPHPMAPRVAPPSVRATPAPAARPQFSAPQASRPSVSAPVRSAPSVGRSAPSSGGGGGAGRGGGGGNGGGNGRGGRGN